MTNQEIIVRLIAVFSVCIMLFVLRCWIELEHIVAWYRQRDKNEPRVINCPFKRSRMHKLLYFILRLRIVE
jgi:hypothetical protein